MFRTTHHKGIAVPHRVALVAAVVALASWSWAHQALFQGNQSLALQEELQNGQISETGRALLDVGVLLLLRGARS